ncbi:Mechanosensitive ion channel [Loktanella sp. DSM 29012]|uniref:mechanosensitive ion channel family protein n=1 Tax=Loktanella sp. DSM 29012 TaxID=1881056 RepID=UPI0008BF8525|nr:mechanosensitive ion channel domain-containing protein [Loktanella sp. DSM 29012]SEP83480.1 Mechanosensitive ion channel [Loktanella sp. DSM 29012]
MRCIARYILITSLWISTGLFNAAAAQDAVFESNVLNVGLGEVPDTVDRSSPQSTLEALLDLAELQDFKSAAHLLNLSPVPVSEQAEKGPELAEKLYEIITRKVVIDWTDLIDRPDGMDANATTDGAVAGQARRSILLWVLIIDDRPYPIRLDRIQVGDTPPVWVFSQRSVANIEKLHAKFRPSRLEEALPGWTREIAFWHLMWWEVFGIPLMLVLAGLSGVLTHKALSRVADNARRSFRTEIVQSTRMPAMIFVMTTIIAGISAMFVFSGGVSTFISPFLALGYVLTTLILVINVIDRIIDRLVDFDDVSLKSAQHDGRRSMATKISLARRILIVAIFVMGAGIVMTEANLFRTFGFSLLASAGALTLILGFAAREVLSNIMSSMQIALNQSARIGDKVLFKDHVCHVERINFTFVQLRVWTGVRLVVPVTEFVAETFENWTLQETNMKRLIEVKVAHTADVENLRQIFYDVIETVDAEELGDKDEHLVMVTDHDVFGQEVTFALSCADPNTSFVVSCDVREKLISRMQGLERTGVEVFPEAEPVEAV